VLKTFIAFVHNNSTSSREHGSRAFVVVRMCVCLQEKSDVTEARRFQERIGASGAQLSGTALRWFLSELDEKEKIQKGLWITRKRQKVHCRSDKPKSQDTSKCERFFQSTNCLFAIE